MTVTLPYEVRLNSPFLIDRHEALLRAGYSYQHSAGGSLSGGEGWLYYEQVGRTPVHLHTNSGIEWGTEHLGYGEPAWRELVRRVDGEIRRDER